MATGYRLYLLSGAYRVAVKACDCTSDVDALLEADDFLRGSTCASVEIWSGTRCVAILSKPAESIEAARGLSTGRLRAGVAIRGQER